MSDTVAKQESVYEFSAMRLHGEEESLSQYKGQVLLIVNTASKCGFTNQYAGLESLQKELHDKGFSVLGFPCNQFGSQEPGSSDEIKSFCQLNYGVSFPMFDKVDVNGQDAHPLFTFLKKKAPGVMGTEGVKWNFTKFLVNKDGKVVERFAPQTKPESIKAAIESLL
ncbi:MAG: glutathione peroxidase [Pseudomonadota bacterium]|nr:glutathione peroxidase [Gammaproteobacteria bacterium]MEC8009494.1 glutathione peroxidase [Pseudomonadota bacterium]HBF08639.1 glutathione peroxidase [Gammaproteobacteria bacterium]|tara:strand:+ start:304 stop:804 length:501 start_codon:yes stop_codon:yes gene_type:complete